MRTRGSTICFLVLVFLVFLEPIFALKKTYVVYMGAHSREPETKISSVDYDRTRDKHHSFLGSFLGSKEKAQDAIFYSYTRHINGFAATLDDAEAAEIAKHPEVLSVFLNKGNKLHTTRSWNFMGLEHDHGQNIELSSAWSNARFGEDTIIGNLDTGVWPESKSFNDDGFGPIPAKWKGGCDQNDYDASFKCNRKLIGARYFNKGYNAAVGAENSTTYNSPRDMVGHGTHTLSTAAGNFVPEASFFGLENGTAKGGSPRARVAAYKVCGPAVDKGECFDADILAGFDMAIHDGVDVISVSLGGASEDYFENSVAIGSFHALKHGIVVVCSAGNDGPTPELVSNVAPWIITVGASTVDRQISSYVVLGNNMRIRGESFSDKALPNDTFFPIVAAKSVKAANASDADAELCMAGTLDPTKVNGKILVCLRGGNERLEKGIVASKAGAAGMVIANDESQGAGIFSEAHFLPALHINYVDGLSVYSYINSTTFPNASIIPPTTEFGIKPAPVMAYFSSRGPNAVTPEILKPDITAPGVNILAAYTEADGPTDEPFDQRRVSYIALSGTSMSCPHVSGVVGLLKTLHPDWSPAAIRSAIMTTARTRDNAVETIRNDASNQVKATPFSYGAGHIRPTRAMDPGLVYDLKTDDYLSFVCSLGYNQSQIALFTDGLYTCPKPNNLINLNYPSITVPNLNGTVTVTRTLKNVGAPATYTARIVNPAGLSVDVQPKTLSFATIGEEKTFTLTISATKVGAAQDYVFGTLTWFDGQKHSVRSQIVVQALV